MRGPAPLLCCLCIVIAVGAYAAKPLNVVVYSVQLDNAPVKVDEQHISVGWTPPKWVPTEHAAVLRVPEILPFYMQYTNQAQKPIAGVRFMCAFYDAFGDYLDVLRLISLDAVAPAQTDYGRWQCLTREYWLTAAVVIFPQSVRFADGSVWAADMSEALRKCQALCTAGGPPGSPGTLNFQAWHITSEPREYMAQRLKDLIPPKTGAER